MTQARLTHLYARGARVYWALLAALVAGLALAVGGGGVLLQLNRTSHARHERIIRSEAALTEQILLAERNCQRYLLTGDPVALDAYRQANDGIERSREAVVVLARDLAGWEPGLATAATLVIDRLMDWRKQYVLPAIEYRLSQRWQELEQFNRQENNALWYGRLEAALGGLHDRLRLAAQLQDAQAQPSWLGAAIAFGGGIALVACALLVFVPVGVRALSRLRARSRLAESLMTFAEEVHGATSAGEIYMTIGRAVVLDGGASHCNILKRGAEERAELVLAEGGQPAARRTSPVLDQPALCPVLRDGARHQVADVRRHPACSCPLGVPVRGGYACIPLLAQGRVHGLVNVQSFRERMFDDEHLVDHLDALGRVGSLALSGLQSLVVARREATIDALTGLSNRRAFEARLAELFRRAGDEGFRLGLLMLDLDRFKSFNDTHGHPAGDALLRGFARMAARFVRDGDVLARYGGEEFVALLPGITRERAREVADRIREGARTLVLPDLPDLPAPVTTVSIGVSHTHGGEDIPASALQRADEALYRAKQGGRDRTVVAWEEEVAALPAAGQPA